VSSSAQVVSSSLSSSLPPRLYRRWLHPLHGMLLGAANAFFISALLCDWGYFASHEIQWKNFACWLIIGGLLVCGCALLWALVDLVRIDLDRGRRAIAFVLLLAAFVLGVIGELVHAKDAWASMPEALIVSAIVAVLAIAATTVGFSTPWPGGR